MGTLTQKSHTFICRRLELFERQRHKRSVDTAFEGALLMSRLRNLPWEGQWPPPLKPFLAPWAANMQCSLGKLQGQGLSLWPRCRFWVAPALDCDDGASNRGLPLLFQASEGNDTMQPRHLPDLCEASSPGIPGMSLWARCGFWMAPGLGCRVRYWQLRPTSSVPSRLPKGTTALNPLAAHLQRSLAWESC